MDFDHIIVKESPGLCRCCLSEGCYKDLSTEYPWMEDTEVYADMLLECFDISISQHIDGPNGPNRLICEVCITRLRDACNFKKQVLESEKKFVDMIGRGEFRSEVIYEDHMKDEMGLDSMPMDAEGVEFIEDDFDNESLKDEATSTLTEVTATPLPVKAKKGRPKKRLSGEKTEKKAKVAKLEDKPRTSKSVSKGRRTTNGDSADSKRDEKSFKLEQESFDNERFLSEIENMTATRKKAKQEMSKQERLEVIRRNIAQVLVNSTVHPFKWARSLYRCFFCCEEFKDPTNLLPHFGSHSTPEEIYLTMNNYWETIVYVDVSTISCKLCPTKIEKLQELIDHLIQNHQIDFNKNVPIGMVPFKLSEKSAKCLECDLVFRSYAHLFVHTVRSHQHYSVIHCNICGQHFKSSQDMYVHKSRTHSKKEAKCTVCGLMMPVTKIKTHLQNFHGKKYDCFHCPEKFVTHYQRARHFIEVHKSREKMKCTYCPRTFVFGSSLKRHVREIHLREKDSVCDVCGWEGFGRARMERHMMKHSDERNIKCPECDKAYKTRKTMRQHFRNTHRRQESAALFVDA